MPQTFNSKTDQRAQGDGRAHELLSKMISQGRSFSGHERNCCFLNTGSSAAASGRFADFSFGSGLDFPDDARAIALADWDHDGDVDLWISNRNAPRLRMLRNDSPGKNHFLSIRLRGDAVTTNRDAIGARVEVVLVGGGEQRLIRSLRAGEGFLSQSGKWLHFGLGADHDIAHLVVRWPNRESSVEQFDGCAADGRYLLIQGSGKARAIAARSDPVVLEPRELKLPPASRAARIHLVPLVKAPQLNIQGTAGDMVSTGAGKPVLINLWASWCKPCRRELSEMTRRAAEIRRAGLEIIALSVDGVGTEAGNAAGDPQAAAALLAEIKFPFASAAATQSLVASFQQFHDAHVGLHRPLPVPTSFLIDSEGRLAMIYKGSVEIDTVLGDLQHTRGTRAERWLRSAALPGRAIQHPAVMRTADTQVASIHYRYAISEQRLGNSKAAKYHYLAALAGRPDFSAAHRGLGNIYLAQQDAGRAAEHFQKALRFAPQNPDGHYALAKAYLLLGRLPQAKARLLEAVRLRPDHVAAVFELAATLAKLGQAPEAVQHYRAGLKLIPDHAAGLNNLAWLLATHPDGAIRNGVEALQLASKLTARPEAASAMLLDTLAAAQAESGDVRLAVKTARHAIAVARAANQDAVAAQIATRLAFYQRGKPYREDPRQ